MRVAVDVNPYGHETKTMKNQTVSPAMRVAVDVNPYGHETKTMENQTAAPARGAKRKSPPLPIACS